MRELVRLAAMADQTAIIAGNRFAPVEVNIGTVSAGQWSYFARHKGVKVSGGQGEVKLGRVYVRFYAPSE